MNERNFETFLLPDAGATRALGRALAAALCPGDVILLSGDLGAGKTEFARAVIQERLAAAGRFEEVPSPSYTLVQTYDDGKAEIWHADLYRLAGADEIAELGLDEAFTRAICLVEWPERLGDAEPPGAVTVRLAHIRDADGRLLRVKLAPGARPALVAALADALGPLQPAAG